MITLEAVATVIPSHSLAAEAWVCLAAVHGNDHLHREREKRRNIRVQNAMREL